MAGELDRLAAALVSLADTRASGNIQREAQRIDVGRVISTSPVRIRLNGLRLTIEDEDFVTNHGYTPAVGHVVVVFPLASGGFFVIRASG